MNAFETTAEIARASFRVLRRHRHLLWFPALSIASVLGLAMLFLPALPDHAGASGGVALALLYFALELVSVFFTAALTCEALRALRGQETSVQGGLGSAATRLRALAEYAGIESSIGLALGLLSRGDDARPSLAQRIFGLGWSLVSYLAIPVLMAERRGGYDSLVRSGKLFRKTWGETSLAELGFRVVTANFVLLVVALLVLLSRILDEPVAVILVLGIVLAFAVVFMTAQAIYRSALYIYAAEGVIPDDFDTPEMHGVWKVK